jgi:hypothetical protein
MDSLPSQAKVDQLSGIDPNRMRIGSVKEIGDLPQYYPRIPHLSLNFPALSLIGSCSSYCAIM